MLKCYSIETVDNKFKKELKEFQKIILIKIINMKILKKYHLMKIEIKKAEFYRISLKQGKLQTQLELKDDINNFNDKRYMIDNLISKPHEMNL